MDGSFTPGASVTNKPLLLIFIWSCLIFVPGPNAWGQVRHSDTSGSDNPAEDSVQTKSPMGALMRSVAFPGWGQFYNHKYLKSAVVFGAETTFITMAVVDWTRMSEHHRNFQNPDYPDRYGEFDLFRFYEDRRNLFLWITGGIVFLSMFDAYVDAHLYDFKTEQVRDLSVSVLPGMDADGGMKIVLSISF
jgi:hypothetical protein